MLNNPDHFVVNEASPEQPEVPASHDQNPIVKTSVKEVSHKETQFGRPLMENKLYI